MKNEIDDIAKQKESLLTFTFDQENDQLLIKAQSEKSLYYGFLEPNPLITFDKIKKVLLAKNYEIVSMNSQKMQITIAGVIDLELRNQDQLNLEFLKETIQKLTTKVVQVQKKLQKSFQLELIIKEIQNEIVSIKNIQEQQKMAQQQKNITFDSKFGEVKAQFDSNNNTQKQSIEQIKQEILQLREEIIKQKEVVSDNSSKITLNQQELKEMIAANSEKIDYLKTEQSELKDNFQLKQGENDRQAKSVLLIISSMEQEIKKTSKCIENLLNKIDSNDQKQIQQITQVRELIEANKIKQDQNNNSNLKKFEQNSAEIIRSTQLHDGLKNEVAQIKNQSAQNKKKLELIDQEKSQKITNLNAYLTQLRTQFDQLITQTLPHCLPYPPEFLHGSQIVCTVQEKCIIRNFFRKKTIELTKLLYRASENNFCTMKFHEKCDGIANTLTVITTEFNKKIGGFTPLKWGGTQEGAFVADNKKESFIFSLTHNDKFTLRQPEYAIRNIKKCGPRFGDGYDLFINDKKAGFNRICVSYYNQKYKEGDQASFQRFNGSKNTEFITAEWQVWSLEFL